MPTLTSTTDLNVRSGPSEAYDVIGLMRQGQMAELIGMSPDGQWWTIRFPAVASQQGWVSAAYATVENAGNVPIVQPPPLPTTTAAPTSEATATMPPLPTATEPPAVFPTLPTEPTLPAMTLPAEQPTVTYP